MKLIKLTIEEKASEGERRLIMAYWDHEPAGSKNRPQPRWKHNVDQLGEPDRVRGTVSLLSKAYASCPKCGAEVEIRSRQQLIILLAKNHWNIGKIHTCRPAPAPIAAPTPAAEVADGFPTKLSLNASFSSEGKTLALSSSYEGNSVTGELNWDQAFGALSDLLRFLLPHVEERFDVLTATLEALGMAFNQVGFSQELMKAFKLLYPETFERALLELKGGA